MNQDNWRPGINQSGLKTRADLLMAIRQYFTAAGVLEVETPLLGSAAGTDPNLDPVTVEAGHPLQSAYLQTSPEFAMKRLLAAGSGPIFQICKAFRSGETGSRHNPEFTMLEWYRPDFSMEQLMDDVAALLVKVSEFKSFSRISYRDLFLDRLDIDPHQVDPAVLKSIDTGFNTADDDNQDKDFWLDLVFSHVIEPTLQQPTFIFDYPASQAALACIARDEKGIAVAKRFELVIGGMELANGYLELTDAQEQSERFRAENQARQVQGKLEITIDDHLLAAMQAGLPQCAGVALGVDRLLMLIMGKGTIDEVLAFSAQRV